MRVLPWFLRKLVRHGSVTLIGPDGRTFRFGGSAPGPDLTLRVTDPGLDFRLLRNPRLAIAEAYMDGGVIIEQGDLRGLMELYQTNKTGRRKGTAETGLKRFLRLSRHFLVRNTPRQARRNAAAHYDIGNDLYRLFLDADMQYSCAYFPRGNETLDEAQTAKKRHIAAKLRLEPGQRVLDIGCGWGGLALYLAQVSGVEVLGITLAENQLRLACERAEAAGLVGRVRFELQDYRAVEGRFDRIVSVGMLEHVGSRHLDAYFDAIHDRLAPCGLALVHSITAMEPPGVPSPFTRRYIFPGGYTPAVSETVGAIERTGLWLLDCEIWRKHYAFTLRDWYRRFAANREKARAMFDERFCRMWELYLAGAESAFLADSLAVMQLQLGLVRDAAPLTRDYIAHETRRLREREAGLIAA